MAPARLDVLATSIIVPLLPLRALSPLGSGSFNLGVLAAAMLWVPVSYAAFRQRSSRWLLIAFGACLVAAPGLTYISLQGSPGRRYDGTAAQGSMLFLLAQAITLAALLWARQHLSIPRIAVLFGGGMLVNATMSPQLWSTDPWKYAFAFPTCVIALAIGVTLKNKWSTVSALIVLMAITLTQDYRSLLAILTLALAIYAWRVRAPNLDPRGLTLRMAVVGVLGFLVYKLGVALALAGHLGHRNQIVTYAQIERSGSLIAGARPEWNATFALLRERPIGYGPGVVPSATDVHVGAAALADANIDVHGNYVTGYLFGGPLELHSVAADLWITFGLAGLVVSLLTLVVLAKALTRIISSVRPSGLQAFLIITALWDLAFSPIGSNLPHIVLALGLLLPASQRVGSSHAPWSGDAGLQESCVLRTGVVRRAGEFAR